MEYVLIAGMDACLLSMPVILFKALRGDFDNTNDAVAEMYRAFR